MMAHCYLLLDGVYLNSYLSIKAFAKEANSVVIPVHCVEGLSVPSVNHSIQARIYIYLTIYTWLNIKAIFCYNFRFLNLSHICIHLSRPQAYQKSIRVIRKLTWPQSLFVFCKKLEF